MLEIDGDVAYWKGIVSEEMFSYRTTTIANDLLDGMIKAGNELGLAGFTAESVERHESAISREFAFIVRGVRLKRLGGDS